VASKSPVPKKGNMEKRAFYGPAAQRACKGRGGGGKGVAKLKPPKSTKERFFLKEGVSAANWTRKNEAFYNPEKGGSSWGGKRKKKAIPTMINQCRRGGKKREGGKSTNNVKEGKGRKRPNIYYYKGHRGGGRRGERSRQ